MASAVNDASAVCCFITPEYENSAFCKLELEHAHKYGKRIIPCMLSDIKVWKPSSSKRLNLITGSILEIDFSDTSDPSILAKVNELTHRINNQRSSTVVQATSSFNRIFESIRKGYLQNNCIQRIMNEGKSFPIEQSYVNLAIVAIKEQQEQERKLRNQQYEGTIINTFEDIYGAKTSINMKDLFNDFKKQTRKVLVLGRAGIGKSTFCRYVTYRWAQGELWTEYEFVILIQLRLLTTERYPVTGNYSLNDLLKREYFPYEDLSEEDRKYFTQKCHQGRVLWLLDGYDEFASNTSEELNHMFNCIRETQHHILTSRPYAMALPYKMMVEITGFTDDNILKYVDQFFNQMQDELQDASSQGQRLLKFLQGHPNIWGIAHIPVNLELICSLWSDHDWSETKALTITTLYTQIIHWLCRRYVTKQKNIITQTMSKNALFQHCQKELSFLETVAFYSMEDNAIIIRPKLLERAEKQSDCLLMNYPQLLNIGLLKSLNDKPVSSHIETEKQHYFVHLSFQEYFAARYLVAILSSATPKKAFDFIKYQKYQQRFALVFSFVSGLITETDNDQCINLFWNAISGEPVDLVGLRHIQLVITCVEETMGMHHFYQGNVLVHSINEWIRIAVSTEHRAVVDQIATSLQKATALVNEPFIQDTFIELLQTTAGEAKLRLLSLLSKLKIMNPSSRLIDLLLNGYRHNNRETRSLALNVLSVLDDKVTMDNVIKETVAALYNEDDGIRRDAFVDLWQIGSHRIRLDVINALMVAAHDPSNRDSFFMWNPLANLSNVLETDGLIDIVLTALKDDNHNARYCACQILERMGRKAAKPDVVSRLLIAFNDEDAEVRASACNALGCMGEKAATSDVIDAVIIALRDDTDIVRRSACATLKQIAEHVVNNDVINAAVTALRDPNFGVRREACEALGQMGGKAASKEVFNGLSIAVEDPNDTVRLKACVALGIISNKNASNDAIHGLVTALGDTERRVGNSACQALCSIHDERLMKEVIQRLATKLKCENDDARARACLALGRLGVKAVTDDVINALLIALKDKHIAVRVNTCYAFALLNEKIATNDTIDGVLTAMQDENHRVRACACSALGKFGRAVTTDVRINSLLAALEDENSLVRGHACQALGEMEEDVVTDVVISRLSAAIGDQDDSVKFSACSALGNIGAKAATPGAINQLLKASNDWVVGRRACQSLGRLGEKAATNAVIQKLLRLLNHALDKVQDGAFDVLRRMLNDYSTICQLEGNVINTLLEQMKRRNLGDLSGIPLKHVIQAFFDTQQCAWLPVITLTALVQGIAVIVTDRNIVVFGRNLFMEVKGASEPLCEHFIEAFVSQRGSNQ